ncbi:Structural protein MDM1 [Candida viswanathii]|uniref:Structural protein MDM1 n=1 Tax=Candida viswanathii TaxID=5486 RepID=A0A367YCW2_9ASCO|nr:Structural protein MDM1 [Candida viswanathii]
MGSYSNNRVIIWSAIVLVLLWFVKSHRLSVIISLIVGAVTTIVSAFYYLIKLRQSKPQLVKRSRNRFNFTYPDNWKSEIIQLQSDNFKLKQAIFPESFLISEVLQELIDLILGEFITPWYSQLTDSSLFTDDIALEIKDVIKNLQTRLVGVDFAQLLVCNILPVVQDHYTSFLQAEEIVKNQGKFTKFDSNEYHLAIVSQYKRGKLHSGVTTNTVTSNEDLNPKEKAYLRKKVKSMLPFVLSDNERDNEIAVGFVTEILACTVLCNVFNLLTESDFYNLMIVKLIGDNLRRRDQVKQLRAALEIHTQSKTKNHDTGSPPKPPLSQTTSDLSLQHQLKEKINKTKQQREHDQSLKLNDILFDKNNLRIFREFMEHEGKAKVLAFWEEVELIKAPLEGVGSEDDPLALSLEFGNSDDVYQIYVKFIATGDIPTSDIPLFIKLANSTDPSESTMKIYHECRIALFKLQNEVFEQMDSDCLPSFKESELYYDLVNQTKPSEVNPEVIHAVESAFTQIMNKPENLESQFGENDDNYDQILSTIQLKKELFGDVSTYGSEDNLSNRNSKLFDDDLSDDYVSDTDSDSLHSDRPNLSNSDLEVQFAAPGNLNLAEEIPKLTEEVENLQRQISVLDPLIKKAELTNNISELKVLQKLKTGMVRDINFKELQKQQYIVQENDNSLYGKSRVCIQSYISDSEKNGKEFTLYIIEMQKFSSEDPNEIKAGWVVARRFSQFYRLHEYLKSRYAKVGFLKFPKKSILVLKFQQKQVVEIRQIQLEEYLQELIKIQEVCSDKAFRSFLSSENFNLKKNQRFEEPARNDNNNSYQALFGNKWYRGISDLVVTTKDPHDVSEGPSGIDSGIMENIKDMEKELKQFDEESTQTAKTPFVKPLCNLLITVFKLHNSKNWLRGRALVVILQQILGTTVEKKVYDMVEVQLKAEENVLDLIVLLKGILFPNGKFKDPPVLRSLYQQSSTRQEAKMLLEFFIFETCSRIFGSHNSIFASNKVFKMIQNEYLNRHLVFEIFDEIMSQVFPEIE